MYGYALGGARRTPVRPLKRQAVVVAPDPEDPGSSPVEPGGSGLAMPNASLPGWNLTWSNDFLLQADEGKFLNVYGGSTYDPATAVGNGRLGAYPLGYLDTKDRGNYDPGVLSVSDSILKKHIYTDAGGVHRVACVIPRVSAVGKWGSASGGRFAIRARSDVLPTYKVAWLLWPRIGGNVTGATAGLTDAAGKYIGGNGEIDFPESDLDGSDRAAFFSHRQNGRKGLTINGTPTSAVDQYGATHPTAKMTDAGWHTYELEWVMGVSLKAFVDGVQLGTTQTTRVPATAMDWKLQTETMLNTALPIDANANGYLYIDWLVYWTPS